MGEEIADNPVEIIVEVLNNNGYSVNTVIKNLILEIRIGGGNTCLMFIDCLTRKLDKLDDMFVRIDDENWIPLSLYDPRGFDKMLEQLRKISS